MTATPAETPAGPETATSACYVYGIVPADAEIPHGLRGVGEPSNPVALVPYGDVAALVSELEPGRPLGTRHDLLAHERVVDTVIIGTTVLPLRFGAVLADAEAVANELLAPFHDRFARKLAELSGHSQFTVRGRYAQDVVLREVLAEEPEAARLREALHGLPEDAGYYDRVRLGELVFQALQRRRDADAGTLVDVLAPYAAAVHLHRAAGDDGAVDAAFLVADRDRGRFDRAVEELGRGWAGRVRLRMLGPLAPYDFVDAEIEIEPDLEP